MSSSMARSSTTVNAPVLENYEESRVEAEDGRVFNERPCWPTLDSAPLLFSTPQDDEIYMKLLRDYTHFPSDYYHLLPGGLLDDFQPCYEDVEPVRSANTTTAEEIGLLALCPPSPRPTSDDHGPLSADGSTLRPGSLSALFITSTSDPQPLHTLDQGIEVDPPSFWQAPPQAPATETNVTTGISPMPVPLQSYRPPIRTPPFSRPGSHPNDLMSDYELFATIPIRSPIQDGRTATDTFDEMGIHSSSSNQSPSLHTYTTIYPPNPTLNGCRPLNHYSTYDKATPPDFRLEHRGRQFTRTDAYASNPLRSRTSRSSKTYRCHFCDTTFAQKQGVNRHVKDVHLDRNLCPYCSDFEWSPGRYYKFREHLMSEHPGVAVPTTWP